jgi:acyl-CoA synthetase (NDP forming)
MRSFDFLFNPKTVALIGASHSEDKLGGIVLKNLLRFKGKVYPVNPKYGELMGLKTYPSVKDLPEPVDLSLLLRPADEIIDLLMEHEGKAKGVVIMSSGFAETGKGALQEEVRKVGKELGLRMLGPNCMGIFNPYLRLDTFFLSPGRVARPKKGNVAVVSQSGAIMHCLFGIMRDSNMGISSAVTYGNAIDLDETDFYAYYAADRKTEVVISYIESVGDGREFIERAKQLSARKHLVILKGGKQSGGRTAAYSHTGRLAGKYEVFRSMLEQCGITEARDFDDLIDTVKALSYQKPVGGNRVLIITNGGGAGVLAADECLRQGLEIPPLPDEKKAGLKQVFPYFYGVNNPLDLTAQVKDGEYLAALEELKDCYDGFLVIALTGVVGITPGLANLLGDFKKNIDKPMVFHTSCSGDSGKLISIVEKAKIPSFSSPECAVRGLRTLLKPNGFQ